MIKSKQLTDAELKAELDAEAEQAAFSKMWEEADAAEREMALDLAGRLSRRSLLVALDWNGPGVKTNTKRLRAKVRALIRDGAINSNDLYRAHNRELTHPRL